MAPTPVASVEPDPTVAGASRSEPGGALVPLVALVALLALVSFEPLMTMVALTCGAVWLKQMLSKTS